MYYRSLHRRKLVAPGYIVENLYNDLIIGLLYFSYAIIVLFTGFLNRIWYYLQLIAIYLSSPSGASQSTRTPKSTCFERFNFWYIYRRLRSGMQTKHLLIVLTFLMTQCSLQLCLCLCCNQTRRFIYRSGEVLHGECSYREDKAMYAINLTQQDCPMKNTDKILQYYKSRYTCVYLFINQRFINRKGSYVQLS